MTQLHLKLCSKLKRDSTPYTENASETDRLLLQKDEEVSEKPLPPSGNKACQLRSNSPCLQIRRMQDILAQMQEKLKASGQVGVNVGLRGRVGSLGNDLDATDVDKKRSSIIDV